MMPLFAWFGLGGPWELLILAGIVLLFFGNRLPSVMRSLGTGIVEFKKGVSGIEDKSEEETTSASSSEEKKETETAK